MRSGNRAGITLFVAYFSLSQCSGDIEPFVVGGGFANIAKYPHSVFLTIDCVTNSWICGSSILNQRILLSAAHCLVGCRRSWDIEAFAGHEDLTKVNVVRSVIKFVQHEKYNDKVMTNDIALLGLDGNLPLGRYIKRVIIRRWHSPDAVANVAGWGVVNRITNKDSMVLKTARQRLMSPRSCARYGRLSFGMMCARSPEKNTSPASGDSGSALITADSQQIDCNGKWICGSSVLNQKILLTAAHCLFGCEVKGRIDAFAGHENIRQVKVKRKAQKIIIHERYNDKTIINDIGLILLQGNLPLGDSIKRVIITKQDNTGLQGVVAGWGVVNDGTKQGTALLKWAKQTVRSKQTCLKLGNLLPGVMCAGSVYSKYARPSQGDSGSALIAPKYRQIGIVSFRYSTYPGLVIYTNISYHLEWIKKKSRALYCGKKM
ncbi:unnamed protein product, partial [Iphiclides podalirius]